MVGHSLGGAVALAYAATGPDRLRHLILVDSVGLLHRLVLSQTYVRQWAKLDDLPQPTSKIGKFFGRLADFFLEKASRVPLEPQVILQSPELRRQFLAGEPARIAAMSLVETDFSLQLTKVTVPTVLLWGSDDTVAPLRIAKILQWLLPRVELKILPGRGHSPMREDAEEFGFFLLGALAAEPRPGHPKLAEKDAPKRQGRCEGLHGQVFSGHFSELTISGCSDVRLEGVRAGRVTIADSEVSISGAIITVARGEGMDIRRSRVQMTGVDILAETGILLDQSRLDAAGVRFMISEWAVEATGHSSSVIFSSSSLQRENERAGLHLSRGLRPGETL